MLFNICDHASSSAHKEAKLAGGSNLFVQLKKHPGNSHISENTSPKSRLSESFAMPPSYMAWFSKIFSPFIKLGHFITTLGSCTVHHTPFSSLFWGHGSTDIYFPMLRNSYASSEGLKLLLLSHLFLSLSSCAPSRWPCFHLMCLDTAQSRGRQCPKEMVQQFRSPLQQPPRLLIHLL